MLFEVIGGVEVVKLKNEEFDRGRYLYLFIVESEWEVVVRKIRIVGFYSFGMKAS